MVEKLINERFHDWLEQKEIAIVHTCEKIQVHHSGARRIDVLEQEADC